MYKHIHIHIDDPYRPHISNGRNQMWREFQEIYSTAMYGWKSSDRIRSIYYLEYFDQREVEEQVAVHKRDKKHIWLDN